MYACIILCDGGVCIVVLLCNSCIHLFPYLSGLFVPLKRITKCQVKSGVATSATPKDKGLKKTSSSSSVRNRDKMMTHSLSTEYQV